MKKQELIKLFKSGNFTIVYWDNEEPTVYKGKWDIDKEYKKDEYKKMDKNIVEIDLYDEDGYVPAIVVLLTESLGGITNSI